MKKNEQEDFWQGSFGNDYTIRNVGDWDELYKKMYGLTRTELNEEFLKDLSKDSLILEVGCNRGNQLRILEKQGFRNLWGLDVNKQALNFAKENKSFNIVESSAFDIPFKENYFDLVFTSGVLIHIAPENLSRIMDEMYRVTKKYIWCFEYFSEDCTEIEYRGHKNKLWKNDFLKIFQERYHDLKVIRQRKIKYVKNDNIDMVFLLERRKL